MLGASRLAVTGRPKRSFAGWYFRYAAIDGMTVPVFLEIIRELLTETSEQRLERVCGDDADCRYLASKYATLLDLHEERHSAPLKLSLSLQARLSNQSESIREPKSTKI